MLPSQKKKDHPTASRWCGSTADRKLKPRSTSVAAATSTLRPPTCAADPPPPDPRPINPPCKRQSKRTRIADAHTTLARSVRAVQKVSAVNLYLANKPSRQPCKDTRRRNTNNRVAGPLSLSLFISQPTLARCECSRCECGEGLPQLDLVGRPEALAREVGGVVRVEVH
jgi:hypothetical protein